MVGAEISNSMLVLFDDDDAVTTKKKPPQIDSPKLTILRTPLVLPPQPQKLRSLDLRPDLEAAREGLCRDATAICFAGAPRVRFINGSKLYCHLAGDRCVVSELNLLHTDDKKLVEKLDTFLRNYSMITQLEMQPALAPYIETLDFIDGSPSSDLLQALYGPMQLTPYAKQIARNTRVIDWLADKNCKLEPPDNLYQQAIYHMSCNRYDMAADVLLENNHLRLAMLVATPNKDDMYSQLETWRRSKADQHIDTEQLKIFIILSGLTKWTLSNGNTINWLDGLEWTQQLCLIANHYSGPEKLETLSPLIKWVETDTDDPDYHIIATHNPADVISAARSLEEQWFLLETLKSYQLECVDSDVVHCNLASQLSDLRWACFVALHIANNEARNQVLMKCLEQNVEQLNHSSTESWLIQNLKLPPNFIQEAKSLLH